MPRTPLEQDRVLKLTLEYEGTRYAGWQFQTNAVSVQGIGEEAIAKVVGHPVRVHGAGRTDAGVHALGQVAHLMSPTPLPLEELRRAINAHLPDDIAVRKVEAPDPGFHARYSAKGKRYAYVLRNHPHPSVLDRRLHWHLSTALDLQAMTAAARALVGRHDFRGFTSVPEDTNSVRDLRRLEISHRAPYVVFLLEADGFLWKMVRRIVGSLVQVGRGKFPPAWMEALVRGAGRESAGPTAPACGLILLSVDYGAGHPSDPGLPAPWGGFFLAGPNGGG
ncbi:MAG: tRNA pseudouridine(38-40) synthase TruA [Planctomycetota bacterium]|jgi:tRNA pseudouridine38-40 synthase